MNHCIAAAALLAYGGLACISSTMDRHYADIHGRGSQPDGRTRICFRVLGWAGIALSFLTCMIAVGAPTGPVLWCGMLTASAMVLTMLLQLAPGKAFLLGKIGYPAAAMLAASGLLP